MFIYSVRASTIRFFSVIALTILVLCGVLIIGSNSSQSTVYASSERIDFSGIKSDEDRISFIKQFGVNVKEGFEEEEFRIPENFDRIIAGYNEIQKRQGLDLQRYKNKKVTRYTYEAEYNGEDAFVNLIIYKGTVIACDISSASPDGFVEPLVKLG